MSADASLRMVGFLLSAALVIAANRVFLWRRINGQRVLFYSTQRARLAVLFKAGLLGQNARALSVFTCDLLPRF